MRKTRLVCNVMVLGTASILYVVSAMADTMPQPGYMGSLGTLRQQEIDESGFQSSRIDNTSIPEPTQITADDVVQPIQAGNITYITGGVGNEERAYLQAVQSQYNLRAMSSEKNGDFVDDVQIKILDKSGQELVSAPAGPLFYAKLPEGTYTVQEWAGGQSKQQKITVTGQKSANIHFSW